jgi:hypothetical protein
MPTTSHTGTTAEPHVSAETPLGNWLQEWDGFAEIQLRPALGEPLRRDSDNDLVDDSEYEAAIRIRRNLDDLRGIRLQVQAGVVSTPNLFDHDNAESAYYGEVQLGDTFVPFSELRRGNFRESAAATRVNAFRPYVRYRFSGVREGFLDRDIRDDHRGTLGMRYRRVPYVVERTYTEDGVPIPPQLLPGFYFEIRAEVSRIWSTKATEELWNPRLQLDLYSPPFWSGARFVVRTTGEMNLFKDALAPDGSKRVDTRLRVLAGLDLSESLKDLLNLSDTGLQAELLGRFQTRWSNDPAREHSRLYFVPSFGLTFPFQ